MQPTGSVYRIFIYSNILNPSQLRIRHYSRLRLYSNPNTLAVANRETWTKQCARLAKFREGNVFTSRNCGALLSATVGILQVPAKLSSLLTPNWRPRHLWYNAAVALARHNRENEHGTRPSRRRTGQNSRIVRGSSNVVFGNKGMPNVVCKYLSDIYQTLTWLSDSRRSSPTFVPFGHGSSNSGAKITS